MYKNIRSGSGRGLRDFFFQPSANGFGVLLVCLPKGLLRGEAPPILINFSKVHLIHVVYRLILHLLRPSLIAKKGSDYERID